MDSVTDCNNSVEQQPGGSDTDSSAKPSLAQFKKSWGFRRSTIAQREFMDEVGDLSDSPPLVRKGRGCRSKTPQTTPTVEDNQKASARSVLDDLEWSSPSSPASEESKPASETSAGASLDPSMWQDFGSAFHTAFSLLGGKEGLLMDMGEVVATPNLTEDSDDLEAPLPEPLEENEFEDNLESVNNMDDSQLLPELKEDNDVLISSQEEDSDEMTLLQIKQKQQTFTERQEHAPAEVVRGGRGKARARGRGRGRGRGKGRGRGRGRAAVLKSNMAFTKENEKMICDIPGPQLPQVEEEEQTINPQNPTDMAPTCFDITLSPSRQPSYELQDCLSILGDQDQSTSETLGQFDNASEGDENVRLEEYLNLTDTIGYDSKKLCCVCQQKHSNGFMVCCNGCHSWFHGDCVGITERREEGQEYVCSPCTAAKHSHLQSDLTTLESSRSSFLCQSPPGKDAEGPEQQQTQSTLEIMEVGEAPSVGLEDKMVSETNSPFCIGPGCPRYALPESVYCGSDCILQHAAATIKSLSGPKVPKSKGRSQRKAATARAPAKTQRASRTSKRLAEKSEGLEQKKEEGDSQEEAESSVTCDPSLTDVQATTEPSPKSNATDKDGEVVADCSKAVAPSEQLSDEALIDTAPTVSAPDPLHEDSAPTPPVVTEPASPQGHPVEAQETINSNVSKQCSTEIFFSNSCASPTNKTKSTKSPESQSQTPPATRIHETGAIMAKKTAYVIPKKPSGPQSQPSQRSVSTSSQKSSSTPVVQNETRNLPVPPAPSAPSSRPSQPNSQVRQSIKRSLIGILLKRVCDSEDLDMSESDVGKLVTNIETEMFNIFRNTDSKYMNKYRTIMFNLKDPKNKGLLYRVVHGEINPFRLVRMSQKDMQAIQLPEPSAKKTSETKESPAEGMSTLQKPEPVKLDLQSLIPSRTDKPKNVPLQEQKIAVASLKLKASQSSQGNALPDILTCMLKDTTAEHHKHLFDLKCKICTGQMQPEGSGEPAQKKKKVTVDKRKLSWRASKGDESPLRAPPDSPDLDSAVMSSLHTMGSPVLTIVEPLASATIQDSPASPSIDTPASPVMESPASPTSDDLQTAPIKSYTPVVIPAVSTVTISRRDPRTAASRYSALTRSTAILSEKDLHKPDSYIASKDTKSSLPPAPPVSFPSTTLLPKSILMKPSPPADPRLYGTALRTNSSESPEGGTAQFLAKQDILWKGFLNMLTIAKFVTKGYLVSGSSEHLKVDLPDTIQIGGRILPKTVWDYVAKLKTSVTKELCVIRFQPASDEEEVAYVSLFSYFSSRGRFGVVANNNRSIKDMYLFPLRAKEPVPALLQPLQGPGLEKNRPNLLLGLAVVQKTKRPGTLPVEVEEKRPKILSTDPLWIPKPPSLYGSDKVDVFQPYDPEIPISTTPPGSPPGSSDTSITSVSTTSVGASQSTTNKSLSAKTPSTASSNPLQTILKQLFPNKQSECKVSSEASTTLTTVSSKKCSVSMVDPIVQQYGGKTSIKDIEEEDNDFDRPYDPEEEYEPAIGYGIVVPKSKKDTKEAIPELSEDLDDDVAYDPEDESIFEDIQNDNISKMSLDPAQTSKLIPSPTHDSFQVTPASTSAPSQTSTPSTVAYTFPSGTVVVSAETLTEQQRMLEELNKQIEEQKRQLKEQEEALRQQREAVGMFMAHFSVSDSLMSPPSAALPLSKLTSSPSGIIQTDKASSLDSPVVDSMSENDTSVSALKSDTNSNKEKSETQDALKESENHSSAGEVGDSDVAYDPEDESLFDEIQEGVFEEGRSRDSSLSKTGQSSYHSRRHKSSPKRRSNRERERCQSPSRRSQRRSSSRSRRQREKDRHRRSERTSSRHRSRDRSERHSRSRREHTSHRHSYRHRSSSSQRNKHSVSLSPSQKREPSPLPHENDTGDQSTQLKKPDENLPPCSLDNLSDVKTENKELPISTADQEDYKKETTENDQKSLNLASQLDIMLDGKLDSLIPLREIDPPTRDSPQSPDPEPQFSKPDITDNTDLIKTESNTDAETKCYDQKEDIKIESENNTIPIEIPVKSMEHFTSTALCPDPNMGETKKYIGGDTFVKTEQKLSSVEGHSLQLSRPVEIQKSEGIFACSKLDDSKSHVFEGFPIQNKGGCEGSVTNPYTDGETLSPDFREPKTDHHKSRHDSPGFEITGNTKSRVYTQRGDKGRQERDSPAMSDERQYPLRQRRSDRTDFRRDGSNSSQENSNPGRRHNSRRGPDNIERVRTFDQKDPVMQNFGPGRVAEGQNNPRFDISCLSTDRQRPDIGEGGPHRGGHGGPGFRGGPMEGPGPHREGHGGPGFGTEDFRGFTMEGPGPHRGGHGGTGFGRGEDHICGPMEGAEPHRGGHRGPGFGREEDHSGVPMEGPGPHRGEHREPGFGRGEDFRGVLMEGPGFGRGGDHRSVPMECPGPHRGGNGGPGTGRGDDFRGVPMEGPGPHRGGHGGPGFGRGENHRVGLMEGPGPHRGGHGGPAFGREDFRGGPMEGPGLHSSGHGGTDFGRGGDHRGIPMEGPELHREGHGGPGFGREDFRGGPMEGPGPQRGGHGRPGFGRGEDHRAGPMEGPGSHRGGHGGPGFGRGEDHNCGPMEGPGPHRGEHRGPGFGREEDFKGGPMERPGPHRGGYRGSGFGREEDFRGGPREGPGSHRGGHGRPGFGRGEDFIGVPREGPGPNRGGHGGPGFGRGEDFIGVPREGPGPNRGGHGGPGFGRVDDHRGGPIDGPGPHRGGRGGPGFGREEDFRGGPTPGPHRGGHGGPGFGRGENHRGGPMEGPGVHRGGHRGPGFGRGEDFGGGPMEGPGPHRGGLGGPGFGRGEDHRGVLMEGPGPHRGGHGGPGFDTGEDHRGVLMEGPGPHRGGHRGPGFGRGDGERKVMQGPRPHSGRPRGPDLGRREKQQGFQVDGPGSHRGGEWGPDLREDEQDVFPMEGSGPQGGGHRGPNFSTRDEKIDFSTEGPGPHSGGPGRLDFIGPGPNGPFMDGAIRDERLFPRGSVPDCRGPHAVRFGPETQSPLMQHLEYERRGHERQPFFDAGPDRPIQEMEGPFIECADPGGWNTGPKDRAFENNNIRGQAASRPPEINPRPGRSGTGGTDYGAGSEIYGFEIENRGANFRGLNPESQHRNRRGDWEGGSKPLQENMEILDPKFDPNLNDEWRDHSDRGPGQAHGRPFRGPRSGPGDEWRGDYSGPRPVDQGPGGWGPENEWNEADGFDDGPESPHFRRDQKPYTRERGCGRGIRGRHQNISGNNRGQNRRSPSGEGPAQKEDQEQGPKLDEAMIESSGPNPEGPSSHRKEPNMISPRSGAVEIDNNKSNQTSQPQGPSIPQTTPVNVADVCPQNQHLLPRKQKAALLPTPEEGPISFPHQVNMRDCFSPRRTGHLSGRLRGRGRPRR